MARVRALKDREVLDHRDRHIGRVEHALFHPREPRVVGVQVRRPPFGYVIERRPRFLPLESLDIGGDAIRVSTIPAPSNRAGEAAIGSAWEETVIWAGMPVVTRGGDELGFVADVRFDPSDGTVESLEMSSGLTGDVAVGRQTVPVALILGFDGKGIRVRSEAATLKSVGGIAAHAGKGSAIAKKAATEAARKAVAAGAAAAHVAGKSGIGRKAAGVWRAVKKVARESMSEE